MTRRETLVAVLRGTNNYSLKLLNATYAVKGVKAFLNDAESRGISNIELADRLVAFKTGGGSGLANAIVALTNEFNAPTAAVPCIEVSELDSIKAQLAALIEQVNAI